MGCSRRLQRDAAFSRQFCMSADLSKVVGSQTPEPWTPDGHRRRRTKTRTLRLGKVVDSASKILARR
jgi:hypothetical protein